MIKNVHLSLCWLYLELISISLTLMESMWMWVLNRLCLVMVGAGVDISAAGFMLKLKEYKILLTSLPALICDKHRRLPH